jgi:hypothetical protein
VLPQQLRRSNAKPNPNAYGNANSYAKRHSNRNPNSHAERYANTNCRSYADPRTLRCPSRIPSPSFGIDQTVEMFSNRDVDGCVYVNNGYVMTIENNMFGSLKVPTTTWHQRLNNTLALTYPSDSDSFYLSPRRFSSTKAVDTNYLVGDPLFTNAATRDLSLQAGSPAIGAGTSADVFCRHLGVSLTSLFCAAIIAPLLHILPFAVSLVIVRMLYQSHLISALLLLAGSSIVLALSYWRLVLPPRLKQWVYEHLNRVFGFVTAVCGKKRYV